MTVIRNLKGWQPDKPDRRDYLFRSFRLSTGKLPESVDLRNYSPSCLDQGDLGACTAFAIGGLSEFLQLKDGLDLERVSELFLYYNERKAEGTVNYDAGASIRTGIKSLVKDGICSNELWPYETSKFKKKPTTKAYRDALKHQVQSYYRLQTLTDFKQCLSDSFAFCGGIAVYESFMSDDVASSGIVPYPARGEQLLGYHAIEIYGYNDITQTFLCKNSWGDSWGMEGFFTLPYKYLTNSRLFSDAWTIRSQELY